MDNRQSILFADVNLNINAKGWKSEYVPSAHRPKPQQNSLQLRLSSPTPGQPQLTPQVPTPPQLHIPTQQNLTEAIDHEEMYSPIQAKPMPRYSGVPIEAELVNKIQPPAQAITIPIQRQDITEDKPKDVAVEKNTAEDITNQFMAELLSRPGGQGIQGGEDFTKNFVSQLLEGSLTTQPEPVPMVESRPAQPASRIWDSAPIQPRKPCKKPEDQAEWEALLNANLAGMAENEEDFTKDFMANLMGGRRNGKCAPNTSVRGRNSMGGGMRAATPPGLRSVPKSPNCWACSEPVEMGVKIIKVKGYPMHPECFVCTTCFVPLKASNVFISNERLFCREHIKFGPKAIRPLSRGQTPEFTEF